MPKFVHLHTHSHYSLLDGLTKIDQLIKRTKELGMDSVALTDHGVLYGAVEFYKAARKNGIKPILGVETYVAPRDRFSKEGNERYYHLILLCENETGWKNLIKLVSKAHLEGFYYRPRVDKDLLREHHEGLIALSACLGGEIGQTLLAGKYDEAKRVALEYRDIFGADNYFLEVQKHPHIPESEKIEPALIALSKETGIPLVATQDSHYVHTEDAEYHDVLLAVQTGNKLSDDDRMSMKEDDFSILSEEAMAEKFAHIPGAMERTAEIAERCNVELELGKTLLPEFAKPEGKTANGYLRELVEERINRKFPPEAQTAEMRDRVEYEMGVIEKTGFADYFLIVQDLIYWAKSHGIAVGPGRGSAAGSIVSYILDITDINPLTYGLLFERFLNPERIQMPDIDIDFADTRRDEVLAYARQKYGEDRVARIITFGTMAARAAIRDAGRAMGYSYAFCDQIAKLIPFNPTQGMKEGWLDECLKRVQELKTLYDTNPEAKKLIETARHLEGVARHASVHACGTVIAKDHLMERVPVQFAPQDKDTIITQFEMHAIEDLGLLKIDLLGLKNLTIIEEAIRLVKDLHGETLNISKIPLDDKKTFALLQKADTTGVFQFECLSGETLVSNTTIKALFEKKHKNILSSVYLDKGKVHKNKVLGIAKSGVKDVYALIAQNGWHIKASEEHAFLTDSGWKKLKDLKSGDKVLMKDKARHLVFNACYTCGTQINGQKEGKSKFCYRCSAVHYSNPSKEYSRRAMKAARANFFRSGGTTWNKGVTTENSEVWRQTAAKIPSGFTFVPVEKIQKIGPEETYDIAMEAPGNNFVANGFVVHNSSGMRRYMKDIGPTELEDLIALVALFRPGPMELIPSFIKRKHGKEKITYLHPKLEPILKNTYGIGVYQEQMMQIARDLAGYTLPEADTLRKAIGKKIKSLLDEQKEKLTDGMIKNGIPPKTAGAIWDLFPPFARYGFNKSHAACYAMIGYQTAYLRANYPEEFMAALLNAEVSDIERISFLIQEAKQSGVDILPPDINKSFVNFTPEGEKIRFGLEAVKNVGTEITKAIIEERTRRGPFRTFEEVLTRIQHKDLNKKSLESLIKAGAFETLGIERNQALQNIDDILRFVNATKRNGAQSPGSSLFGDTLQAATLKLRPAPPATNAEKLVWEKELIGFYLSEHPLTPYVERLKAAGVKPIAELAAMKDEKLIVRAAGVVSKVKKISTKSGQPMIFATIEDIARTTLEVVVFNSVLERTAAAWIPNNPIIVQGRMSLRDGEVKMICDNAKVITPQAPPSAAA